MKFLRHLFGITKLYKERIKVLWKKREHSTRKSDYNTYRRWTQIEYENRRYNIDQKDEGT
jgi:hypothetical protein